MSIGCCIEVFMPSPTSEATVNALLLRIVAERKSVGVSQERLAEMSGVDLGVISRAENLLRIPGMASILDMAHALQLDMPLLLADAMQDAGQKTGTGIRTSGDSK
jgi:transcriptional regulator with XRE-family HTH domain